MSIVIKKLVAKKPIELITFQIPDTREGLKEVFDKYLSSAPLIIEEVPLPQGYTGIGLSITNGVENWKLEVRSGDWLLITETGDVTALPTLDEILEDFHITSVQ